MKQFKAISIKQPWAYLICAGIKDVENRTWRTKYRGRVYVHASGSWKFTSNKKDHLTNEQFESLPTDLKVAFTASTRFLPSAIIGHVDIVDCVINHKSIWAEKTPLYKNCMNPSKFREMTGIKPIYNFVLSNAALYDEPILDVKGKLSLWDCSEYFRRKEATE